MKDAITRRAALQSIGIGLGIAAAGCGSSDDGGDANAEPGAPAPAPTTNASPAPAPPGTQEPAPPANLSPKDLLAGIEHIVVLMMENRSFDHFLGSLKTDKAYAAASQIEGLAGTESNPAPDGTAVGVFKLTDFTPADPDHSWDASHSQFDGGKNDGFVKAHAGASQNEVMGFHDRTQIPLYYWFADNFAVCDHWFASVMGPTWPNRFYLHSTTSKGKKDNSPFITGAPRTIWDALKAKGVSFKNYAAGATTFYVGGYAGSVLNLNPSARIDEFFDAAKKGTLPAFSIVDPDFQSNDDHPDHNIMKGQAFVASIYKALAESPAWSKTLFIVTYDEHGGFFDHVAPPKTADMDTEFEQLGFRVPAFVIGPMVKKGYVCKKQLEHSSVAATLQTRWDIDSLSKRMDASSDITDCIDANKLQAPAAPPAGMPVVAMSLEAALYDRVGVHSQPMLERMIADGTVTPTDTRTHEQRIGAWLEHAVRLGAVRIL